MAGALGPCTRGQEDPRVPGVQAPGVDPYKTPPAQEDVEVVERYLEEPQNMRQQFRIWEALTSDL
ncbi:hypothetical protein YIM73052_24070 [Thermus antranikianii]